MYNLSRFDNLVRANPNYDGIYPKYMPEQGI
jgi:hypothetical protein